MHTIPLEQTSSRVEEHATIADDAWAYAKGGDMQRRLAERKLVRAGAQRGSSDDDEVSAFLIRSQGLVKRVTEHIGQARAHLAASEAQVPEARSHAERFSKQVEQIRACVGNSWCLDGDDRERRQLALVPSGASTDARTEHGLQSTLLSTHETLQLVCEELRQARRLLEREHAKYVDLAENESVATLITDEKAAVRDANRAAAATLGVERYALPGKLLVAFVARQDVDDFREFARPLWNLSGGEARSVILRIRPRGQAVMRARLSVSPMLGITQRRVGLRWMISREVAAA